MIMFTIFLASIAFAANSRLVRQGYECPDSNNKIVLSNNLSHTSDNVAKCAQLARNNPGCDGQYFEMRANSKQCRCNRKGTTCNFHYDGNSRLYEQDYSREYAHYVFALGDPVSCTKCGQNWCTKTRTDITAADFEEQLVEGDSLDDFGCDNVGKITRAVAVGKKIYAISKPETCFGHGGKWWKGLRCDDFNSECGCRTCEPCQNSVTEIDGIDWGSECTYTNTNNRVLRNPSAWPKFTYDTAFSRTDPNKDQEWVVNIEIAAEEESDNYLMEMGSWAMGIAGSFAGSPLAAMIPFAVEKTLEYLKIGEEDEESTIVELDLADTVDRIMEMTMDNNDQQDLKNNLNEVAAAMKASRDDLGRLENDLSIQSSLDHVIFRSRDLRDQFVDSFDNTELISSRPEAAWYLYEPAFALIDARFTFEMLEFTMKWQQASGARTKDDAAGTYPEDVDQAKRVTECANLEEYLDGPLQFGKRQNSNSAALTYQWSKFKEHFDIAWEARLAAIQREPTVQQSVSKLTERYDFATSNCGHDGKSANLANHLTWNGSCKFAELESWMHFNMDWTDSWSWGAQNQDNAAEYRTFWMLQNAYAYCNGNSGCCSSCSGKWGGRTISTNAVCTRDYLDGEKLWMVDTNGPQGYLKQAQDKKAEVFAKYEKAYLAMRRSIGRSIHSCKAFNANYEIAQMQKSLEASQAIPNGPAQKSMLEKDDHCMPVQSWVAPKSCPTGFHATGGNFVWDQLTNTNMVGLLSGTSEQERCPFRYSTLAEAQAACEINLACQGVNMDNGLCGGKKYELRGSNGRRATYAAWEGMTSWVKHGSWAQYQSVGKSCPSANKIDQFDAQDLQFNDDTHSNQWFLKLCAYKCSQTPNCNFFSVIPGDECRIYDACPADQLTTYRKVVDINGQLTIVSGSTYFMKDPSPTFCGSDTPVYETWDKDAAAANDFDDVPGKASSEVSADKCGGVSGANTICLRRYFGFQLGASQDRGSFAVSTVNFDKWGYGDDVYDVQVWRAAGAAFNAAYRGSNNFVPIAEGKFNFAEVDSQALAFVHDSMYHYENEQGQDVGTLRKDTKLPSGFQQGDMVCAYHSNDAAARAKLARIGLVEEVVETKPTCTYQVDVTAHQYMGPWSFEYTGDCGATFRTAAVDEDQVGIVPHGTCGTRFGLQQAVVQVVKDGQATNIELLSCANQGFDLSFSEVTTRRLDIAPGQAPGPSPLRAFTL